MVYMAGNKIKKYSRKLSVPLFLGVIGFSILILFWYVSGLGDNFRIVTSGKCYRSGQMSYIEICQTISQYGIKTIINLRDTNKESWYLDELKATSKFGIKHIDIKLNSSKLPPPQEISALIETLQNSPYPILIHCLGGSDRSGLACAIYLNVIENVPLDIAVKRQLTWRYGHISVGSAHAMDEFFDLYHQTNQGKGLALWVKENYPSIYFNKK